MWQSFTSSGYRDLATRIVELATSGYFENGYDGSTPTGLIASSVGSGYTDGDILTITHNSALAPCQFSISSIAGAITGIKQILNGGAFQNRIATVSVNVGGTGYAVNDIVLVGSGHYPPIPATDGAATNPAKVRVTSVSSGVVTGVALFEDGGSYITAPPTTACITNSSIGNGTGTGLKLNLTLQGVIGTTGIAATGGSGTGAIFMGSLTFAGWTVLKSVNNYHLNSVTDEKEIILQGSAGAGQVPALVGIRTGTNGSGGTLRNFLSFTGMTAFNSSSSYDAQPNAINPTPSTTGGQYISVLPASTTVQCWIGGNQRMLRGVIRNDGAATVYQSYYVGLLDSFGTAIENPYPMVVMASHNAIDVAADSISGLTSAADGMISGITECFRHTGRSGPCVAWSQQHVAWVEVWNGGATSGSPPYTINEDYVVWPVGKTKQQADDTKADLIVADGGWASWATFCRATGEDPTLLMKPSPAVTGAQQIGHAVTMIAALDGHPLGTLNNVYWFSGTKADGTSIAPEDTFSVDIVKYLVFQNAARTKPYSFFAMRIGR